jgi:hypothetical protein
MEELINKAIEDAWRFPEFARHRPQSVLGTFAV